MWGLKHFWRTKRYLRYESVESWIEGERLTTPITQIADPVERDRRITEYGELRRYLFAKHIKTLSSEEQRWFAEGTHPSQSHRFAARAEPFASALRDHLVNVGVPAVVRLGWYHMDRIVLSADLDNDPGDRRSELPRMFRGFEIKYFWPQGEDNLLIDAGWRTR
jgi:hypothetical protein